MPYKDKSKQKEFQRSWHQSTKAARKEKRNSSKQALVDRNKSLITSIKAKGCEACGYSKCLNALEFHHLDPNAKDLKVSEATRQWGSSKLLEEVSKCVLLCSNCHREIHSGIVLTFPNRVL
jgi:hypothetical protein